MECQEFQFNGRYHEGCCNKRYFGFHSPIAVIHFDCFFILSFRGYLSFNSILFFYVVHKAEKKAKSSRKKGEKKTEVKKVKFPEGYSFFQKCFGLTEPVVFRILKQMVDGPLGSAEGGDLIKKARDTRSDFSCSFHLV